MRFFFKRSNPDRFHLRNWILYGCLLMSAVSVAMTSASPVEVVRSDPAGLEFTVSVDSVSFRLREFRDGALTFYEPEIKNFHNAGEPRQVGLPVWSTWIVVPPGTRPVLREVSSTWREVQPVPLMPTPVPVFLRGEADDLILGQELLLPGEKPTTGRIVPEYAGRSDAAVSRAGEPVVSLGDVIRWRNRRIAALAIRPLQVDAAGLARRQLIQSRWLISFEPMPAEKSGDRSGRPHPNDLRFGNNFLNGDILDKVSAILPGSGRPDKAYARVDPQSLLAPEIRIPVAKSGFYRIRESQLRGYGLLTVSGLAKTQLRLYQRRYVGGADVYATIEVPVKIYGGGNDFGSDDYFVFYGLRPRDDTAFSDVTGQSFPDGDDVDETYNPNTLDDVNQGQIYYLAFGDPPTGTSWARMEELTLPAASGATPDSYRRHEYWEEDTAYQYSPLNSTVDRNHWNSQISTLSVPVSLASPATSGAQGRLRAGTMSANSLDRTLGVYLYNSAGDTVYGASALLTEEEYVFDSGETLEFDGLSDWTLRFLDPARPTRETIFAYLDWFELAYNARYRARSDRLDFHCGERIGVAPVEVGGFSRPDLTLFDMSDRRAPKHVQLTSANVVSDGASWKLSIAPVQDAVGQRKFMALAKADATDVSEFVYFRGSVIVNPVDPQAVSGAPDVLVVTHPAFMTQALRWADYRAERSREPLNIHVVDVHTLYDWYSGGLKSPIAIRRFAQYGITEWNSWALQIFGDANENARSLGNLLFEGRGRDWVPASFHLWRGDSDNPNEMLPSDTWFVVPESIGLYPNIADFAPGMLVGRFPGNTPGEIDRMIDKVITFEAEDTGAAWKRRAVILADDAWSSDDLGGVTNYSSWEEDFEESQETIAAGWENHMCPDGDCTGASSLASVRIFLADYLDQLVSPPGSTTRSWTLFENYTEAEVLPDLLTAVSGGAALFHYQGHANTTKFAHEKVLEDIYEEFRDDFRDDVSNFSNLGKPWIFMGLACHISSFTEDQADSRPRDWSSLGEKFLLKENSGACAVYASSGFEYIDKNAFFASLQFDTWLNTPSRGAVGGTIGKSKWVLGDMILQSVMNLISSGLKYRAMAAQYCLLGDALLIVDTGPPAVTVLKDGEAITDGAELLAGSPDNICQLEITALDEAGIDRLEIIDSEESNLSSSARAGKVEADSDRFATWDVSLPIRPFAHDVEINVYDTADVTDEDTHYVLNLRVPMDAVLMLDGAEFMPGQTTLLFDTPLDFTAQVHSGAYLQADMEMELVSRTQALTNTSVTLSDNHNVEMAFTINIPKDTPSSVVLRIGEFETEFVIVPGDLESPAGITDLYCFPNPAASQTRFLFKSGTRPAPGRVLVYSVAGDLIADHAFPASRFRTDEMAVVSWDLHDRRGDSLANGTYLYRVELNTTSGVESSEIQRLVIMR